MNRTHAAVRVLVTGLLGLAFLTGCETNKTTGRSQFVMMSWQEEISLGTQAKPEMLKEYGGEIKKAELRQYVTSIGNTLAKTTAQDDPGLANLPWEFTLLDSPVINAFALPGGKVFFSLGLAKLMTNEAQMAGVLGHEIGHVTARHSNERFSRASGASVGLGVLGAVLGGSGGGAQLGDLAGQAVQISLMSYSRDQESESDTLGMRYMVRSNYDPIAQSQVMEILKQASGGAKQPEWLSTHPLPETRIQRCREIVQRDYAYTQNNPQYQLKTNEFKAQFLSKLAIAYPNAGEPSWDPAQAARERAEIALRAGVNPAEVVSIIGCSH